MPRVLGSFPIFSENERCSMWHEEAAVVSALFCFHGSFLLFSRTKVVSLWSSKSDVPLLCHLLDRSSPFDQC